MFRGLRTPIPEYYPLKKALSAVHSAEGALLKVLLILRNIEIVFPDLDILERIFAAGSVIEEKAADDGPVRIGKDERIARDFIGAFAALRFARIGRRDRCVE